MDTLIEQQEAKYTSLIENFDDECIKLESKHRAELEKLVNQEDEVKFQEEQTGVRVVTW